MKENNKRMATASPLIFPQSFSFGTAVAAFQVEGNSGVRNADWDHFLRARPDIIKPGEKGPEWWKPGMAEKDCQRMQELGMQTQRLSIEWARVEPEEGNINHEALKRYRELIDYLHSLHLQPMITLQHFVLPEWIAKKGSWSSRDILPAFSRFVELLVKEFPDIPLWLTVNEPNGLVESAYLTTYFPPGQGSIISALSARSNMIAAHQLAYRIIKHALPNAHVGIPIAFRWYRPENPGDPFESTYAALVNYLSSLNYLDSIMQELDFIGCNYYTGYYLNLNLRKIHITMRKDSSGIPSTFLFGETKQSNAYVTDMGWPIVPAFFLDVLRTLHKRFHKPIIITENGIADNADHDRAFYILTHLVAVWKAIQEGISISQYIYWSSVDNLEWLEGYREHFGLVHVDPVTGERRMQKSAGLYKTISETKQIAVEELITKYIPEKKQKEAETVIQQLLSAK